MGYQVYKQPLLRSRHAQQALAICMAAVFMATVMLTNTPEVFAKKKETAANKQTTSQVSDKKAKSKTKKSSGVGQKSQQTNTTATTTSGQGGVTAPVTTSVAPASASAVVSDKAAPKQTNTTPDFNSLVLTPDGTDTFSLGTTNSKGLIMIAPQTNTGVNLRQVMWRNTTAGNQKLLNSQTCATWTSESTDMLQEGLALRIFHNDKTGRTKGLTLTKNTIYGIHWVFNVMSWDSNRGAESWTGIQQFDMSSIMFAPNATTMKPMPWRVCARAQNNTFSFKIWFPNEMKEPKWSDKTYVRSVAIPRQFMIPGYTGWYIGHIPANGSAEYSNMSMQKL
jgi:hypothetical protein